MLYVLPDYKQPLATVKYDLTIAVSVSYIVCHDD